MKYRTDIGKRVEPFEQEIAGAIPTPGPRPKAKKHEGVLGYGAAYAERTQQGEASGARPRSEPAWDGWNVVDVGRSKKHPELENHAGIQLGVGFMTLPGWGGRYATSSRFHSRLSLEYALIAG